MPISGIMRGGLGRFATPDPYAASGGTREPASWNRYPYVGGDPTNFKDRRGLQREEADNDFESRCAEHPEDVDCVAWEDSKKGGPEKGKPSGGGGGGDPGLIVGKGVWYGVTRGMNSDAVVKAFKNVRDVLSSDEDCRKFFATSSLGSLHRDSLLDYIDNFKGQTATGTPSDRTVIAQTVYTPVGGYRIFINSGGAFFNTSANRLIGNPEVQALTPGGTQAQAFILLHELAHALGATGAWIDDDGLSEDDTKTNNNLLWSNCRKGLAKVTP